MPSTGFLLPTARTVDAGSGTWTNDVNILADDGAEATFSLTSKNTTGRSLRGQSFGFDSAIPAGATIDQVNIRMEYRVNSTGGVANPEMQAFVSGTGVGSVRTASPLEPTTLTLNTFDITADRSWTRADLLDGTFEVRCWGRNGNSTTDPSYKWDYLAAEVVYTAGQTVTAGQTTETETSQAVTYRRGVNAALVSEAESAQLVPSGWDNAATWSNSMPWNHPTLEPRKLVVYAQVTETESAQSVTVQTGGGQTIPIGQIAETETSQAVTLRKTTAAALVSETETAQAATTRETVAAGQPTETETAQAVTAAKTETVALTTETESAQPVTVRKAATAGQPAETELAQSISVGGIQNIPIGQTTETETVQPVTVRKTVRLDDFYSEVYSDHYFSPVETETTQPVTLRLTRVLGQPSETETAQTVTPTGPLTFLLGQAVEAETAPPVTVRLTRVLGQPAETETAPPVVTVRAVALGEIVEAETALALTVIGGAPLFTAGAAAITLTPAGSGVIAVNGAATGRARVDTAATGSIG